MPTARTFPSTSAHCAGSRRSRKGKSPGHCLSSLFSLGEFLRVVTHPRIFDPPSTLETALNALDGLLESPTLQVLSPGTAFPELFAESVRAADARGNLVFDAQIVAVCLEHGVSQLLTHDRDLARFPEIETLSIIDPLPEEGTPKAVPSSRE